MSMTTVEDIKKLLADMESGVKQNLAAEERLKSFEGVMMSIGQALTDIVGILEKPATPSGPSPTTVANDLAESLKNLKFEAPKVSVNVAAPTVHVAAASEVGAKWEIRQPGAHGRPDRVTVITRTK